MKIYGLQKMTLLDFPGHVACTVFLGGCDFRCPFCHNFELANASAEPIMDDTEVIKFLEKRKGLLDGVAITGGEPCLNRELPDFIQKIRSLGFAVKVDTNGYHPDMLAEILNNSIADYVAMDIKNSPEKYAATCGVKSIAMDKIKESISLLISSDIDYEFRTTAVEELHDVDDFRAIGTMIKGAKKYFIQCFTDRDTVPFGNLHAPSNEKLKEFAAAASEYIPNTELRGVD